MSDPKTYTCGCCGIQHVATRALTPPDWEWIGSLLACGDCKTLPASLLRPAKRAGVR